MPHIDNPKLYEKAKQIADKKYSKPSAYKSGFIVKTYKELGGTYSDDTEPKNLKRWFKEDWKDIAGLDYPVYRPTKRVSKKTPLMPDEIEPQNLLKQSILKQQYKGEKNLPPFQEKEGGALSKEEEILKWSNPVEVRKQADKYLGKDVPLYYSKKKDKKYAVIDPQGKVVNFGQIGYEDYTKHQDDKRRQNYLTRTANMRGNWKDNKYSPNNLSRNILW